MPELFISPNATVRELLINCLYIPTNRSEKQLCLRRNTSTLQHFCVFYYVKAKNLQHYVLNATAVKSKVPQYVGHMSQEKMSATKLGGETTLNVTT
jgi:hypothetical protein